MDRMKGKDVILQSGTFKEILIKMNHKPVTRRGLLVPLSNVCDVLCLGAPFLLKGRLIFQRLSKNNVYCCEPMVGDTA